VDKGIAFFAAGIFVWAFTYMNNRIWLGWKTITGSW